MVALVSVRRHSRGPRLYLAGLRMHHGPGGAILAVGALALRRPRLAGILLLYAATDWRDAPWRDRDNH